MTFEELLKLLAGMENGQQMVDTINNQIKLKNQEAVAPLKTKIKELDQRVSSTQTNLTKFLGRLGIDEEAEDLEEALETAITTLGGNKGEAGELQKQVNKLTSQLKLLTKEKDTAVNSLTEERGKRHADMKNAALFKALTTGTAIKPEQLTKLLLNQVKVDDDDNLIFISDDETEVSIEDGVKAFLTANPEFVGNSQLPGTGTGIGGDKGGGESFAAQLAKTQAEANQKQVEAQKIYFGGGN